MKRTFKTTKGEVVVFYHTPEAEEKALQITATFWDTDENVDEIDLPEFTYYAIEDRTTTLKSYLRQHRETIGNLL